MTSRTIVEKWLRARGRSDARLRLFCFPYSGGGVSAFRGWENSLSEEVELCLIQLPGREDRLWEQSYRDISLLVESISALMKNHLDRPFALYGHSLGAAIAFELARNLRRQGMPEPDHLIVSSHRAPQLPNIHPSTQGLTDLDFIEHLRSYNGTPDAVLDNAELMELLLPGLRADFSMYEAYYYQDEAPLECRITAMGGLQDPKVSQEEMIAWREQTSGLFDLRMYEGDHFFIHSQQKQVLSDLHHSLGS